MKACGPDKKKMKWKCKEVRDKTTLLQHYDCTHRQSGPQDSSTNRENAAMTQPSLYEWVSQGLQWLMEL